LLTTCLRLTASTGLIWLEASAVLPLRFARLARGAVSLERLTQDANGDLVYTFTHPWSDGTTGIRLSPMELLEKLAALVPLPRVRLVRYGGCLAPHSLLRGRSSPRRANMAWRNRRTARHRLTGVGHSC